MTAAHLLMALFRATFGGSSDGKRGSNPNPKWRDPGIPPEWVNGKYAKDNPGAGPKPIPTRPEGFQRDSTAKRDPVIAITPGLKPPTGTVSGRNLPFR